MRRARTLTKEEFTLAGVGITISVPDTKPSNIVTAVQGGASAAAVIDFCSMELKKVHVEVSWGCPAIRHLRERNSPAHRTAAPVSPNSLGGSSRQVPSSTMYAHNGSILHAS